MRPPPLLAALLFGVSALSATTAPAQTAPRPENACFDITRHGGVVALDDKTLLLRSGPSTYRITVAGACPGLSHPDPRITLVARAGPLVCGRLDYDLLVGEAGVPNPGLPCMVDTQHRLTATELADLPPSRRPH